MSQQLGRGRSRIVYLIVTFSLILSFCTPLFELPRALAQAPAPEREKAPDVRQTVTPALTLLPTIPAPTPTVAPTVTPEPPAPAPTPDTPAIDVPRGGDDAATVPPVSMRGALLSDASLIPGDRARIQVHI